MYTHMTRTKLYVLLLYMAVTGRRRYPDEAEMFIVRGECEEEVHLHQIEPKYFSFLSLSLSLSLPTSILTTCSRCTSLRSRACFIIVSPDQEIFVWIGSKAMSHCREFAIKASHDVKSNYSGADAAVIQVYLCMYTLLYNYWPF